MNWEQLLNLRCGRRIFLKGFAGLSLLGGGVMLLSGCDVPAAVSPQTLPEQKPDASTIGVTQLLKESQTIKSQFWYYPTNVGFGRTEEATSTPPPEIPSLQPWYVPEKHFTEVKIGNAPAKVGGQPPPGQYAFYPLVALQSLAVPMDRLMGLEGSSNWFNVYEATANGLLITGILVRTGLAGALVYASISGELQRSIEGEKIIYLLDENGKIKVIDLGQVEAEENVQIFEKTDEQTLAQARPNFKIEILGNSFPPEDWKPPKKDHCGFDMVDYFARLLLNQTQASILRDEIRGVLTGAEFDKLMQEVPILREAKEFTAEEDRISESLRQKNCYFYPQGGSVFSDYKLMRERAYLRAGGYSNPNLTYEEYARIINTDPAVQTAFRQGVNAIEGMFDKNMTTEVAFQLAKQIVSQFWW